MHTLCQSCFSSRQKEGKPGNPFAEMEETFSFLIKLKRKERKKTQGSLLSAVWILPVLFFVLADLVPLPECQY